LSDEIREWAFRLRYDLDKAKAEGVSTVTVTAPVNALYHAADLVENYFNDNRPRCLLCDQVREMAYTLDKIKNFGFGKNPNWRLDADFRKHRR